MPSPVIDRGFTPRQIVRLVLAGLVLMGSFVFSLSSSYAPAQAANAGPLRQPSATPASLTSSTTSLTISPNLVGSGQAITLTASVVPTSATGTVTFSDGATNLGTGSLSGGVATLNVPAGLTVGSHSLKATYGGDSSFSGSTSTSQVLPVFNLTTFTSSGVITINKNSSTTPYPSTITTTGVSGNLISTTVQLRSLTQVPFFAASALLVAPSSQKSILLSKVGPSSSATVDLLFDDGAANSLPSIGSSIVSGTYKPTYNSDYCGSTNFASPAPTGPYTAALSNFKGATTNGGWQLFVRNSCPFGSGSLSSWSLNLYTYPFPVAFGSAGSGQSITVTNAFATPLQVLVNDGNGNPLAGAAVTFTAPVSGASGTFAGGSTVYTGTTDSSGLVTATTFTANTVAGSYNVVATISDTTFPVNLALTNLPDVPNSLSATSGNNQNTNVTDYFAQPLVATVYDRFNNPVGSSYTVTFTAPSSGASGVFANNSTVYTGTTSASGQVTATTFTANSQTGSYVVTATVSGIVTPTSFSLTNDPVSTVQFESSSYAVSEGVGTAVLTLTRGINGSGPITASVVVSNLTTSYSDYSIAAFSGRLDGSFASTSSTGADGEVRDILPQSDGKILVVGAFSTYNGVSSPGIVRLNSDGSVDNSFNVGSGTDKLVTRVITQPDGKLIIAGQLTTYNGVSEAGIARLNSDGSLDTTFNSGSGPNNEITGLALQSDGKILISGSFTTYNNITRNRLARLLSDGSLDTSFDSSAGANDVIWDVKLQPSDSKILLVGSFTTYSNTLYSRIARLNTDGSLDTSFTPGSGGSSAIDRVTFQPDGKILIGGDFTTYSGTNRSEIARLNTDGTLDTSFDPGSGAFSSVGGIRPMVLQPDGKILIAGDFTAFNGVSRSHFARLNSDGSLDTNFTVGSGANNYVGTIGLQSDGRILIGGRFTSYDGTAINRLARVGVIPVTWAAGDSSSKTITLTIVDDSQVESNEQLLLNVASVTNGGTLGSPLTTTLTILDNDRVITATSGSGQSAPVSTAFSQTLVAQVNLASTPVTFTAPSSGPSGSFAGGSQVFTGTSDANGLITTTVFTANSVVGSYNVTATVEGGVTPATFTLTNLSGAAANILAISGSGQSIVVSTTASQPFVAKVTDTFSNPVSSRVVTFSAPSSGSSGSFAGGAAVYTGTTDSNGVVTSTAFTANGLAGSYNVTATTAGVAGVATFQLTNVSGCNPLVVTSNLDNGSCGTLRQALVAASTSQTKTVTINLAAGSVISLTTGLTLTSGVYITTTASCGSGANNTMVPPITLQGIGASSGNGLTLAGHNRLYGLWVRGFSGVQIKAPVGSSTLMQCVKASKL